MSNLTVGELTGYVDLNTEGVRRGAAAGEAATAAMSAKVLAALRKIEAEKAVVHLEGEIRGVDRALGEARARLAEWEGQEASARLDADGDAARQEIARLELDLVRLSTKRVEIQVDIDKDGSGAARLRKMGDEAVKASGHMSGLLSPLKAVAVAGAGLAAMTSGVQVLGGLTAAVGLTAGALGLIPAAAGSAAFGIGALKVATSGFGDALANVGDPEKFAESIEKLSPAARGAAVAVRDMVPAWKEMQQSVQEKFFTGLGQKISVLAEDYIPMLGKGFGEVATSANVAAGGILNSLNSTKRIGDVSGIVESFTAMWVDLIGAVAPLSSVFVDVAAVGAPLLTNLTSGATGAARAFAVFVSNARESGQLREWIVGGLSALGDLAIVAGNVGEILGGIFRAANASGEGFLYSLKSITQGIADMINSAAGQETLRTLFETGATLSNLFMQALQAVLPILPGLVQLLGDVAVIIGTALVGAIQVAAPLVGHLVDFLGMFPGPVAAAVVALAGLVFAFKGVAAAVGIFNTVETIMSSTIGRAVGRALLGAAAYVGSWIVMAAGAMANAVIMAAAWVVALGPVGWLIAAVIVAVGLLVWAIVANWETIKGWLVALGQWFMDLPATIGAALTWLGEVIATGATAAWTWLTSTLPTIIGQAIAWLLSLPGQAMYALGYLAGLVYTGAIAAWHWISETLPQIIEAAIAWLMSLPGRAASFLSNLGSTIAAGARAAWNWLYTTAVDLGGQAIAWVSALPGRIGSFISQLPGIVRNGASAAWQGFLSTTQSLANSALAFIGSIPGRVMGFFSSAGSWLYSAGQNIISGLWNGLVSMAQAVLDWIYNLGQQIAAGFAAAVGIHSPSKVFAGFGDNLGKGLIVGLKAVGPDVIASAARLGDDMSAAASTTVRATAPLYTPTPGAAGQGNTDRSITVTVHNPLPETSSDSINRRARTLALLGSD